MKIDNRFGRFPSPLEVNRFISDEEEIEHSGVDMSYRPLSRWIGLYHNDSQLEMRCTTSYRPLAR